MKCFILIAALCCFGVCAGNDLGLDFLTANILNPLLQSIQDNAIAMLGNQLTQLLAGLFGKRALPLNLSEILKVLPQVIAQVKQIYERLFTVFLQIVQNVEGWINKPDWARIEFVRAGVDAENAVAKLNFGVDFLQPIANLIQTHLGTLITDFEAIIAQVFDSAKHPLQSLIGSGSLLRP